MAIGFQLLRSQVSGLKSPRRGATLLLALFILGSLVATSLTVGAVVTLSLRSVRAIDDGIVASYAAESAAEGILFDVRKRDRIPAARGEGTFPNGARWTSDVTTTVMAFTRTLEQDRVEQLDLFDASGALGETNIRFLEIVPLGTPDPRAWLEVTWVPWLGDRQTWAPAVVRPAFGPSELAEKGVTIALSDVPAGANGGKPVAYRIRLRALHGSIGSVRIRAPDAPQSDDSVPLPGRIHALVRGSYGSSSSASVVEFPPRAPLAPIFDYALFSDCDIVKEGTVTCPSGG